MNRKLFGTLTIFSIALAATGSLAVAGDITLTKAKALTPNVQLINGEVVNCQEVNCGGASNRETPAGIGGPITAAGGVTTASFTPNSGNPFSLDRLSSLNFDSTDSGSSTEPPASSNSGSFVLAGDQVTPISGGPSSPSNPASPSDPIVTPAFNLVAAGIVLSNQVQTHSSTSTTSNNWPTSDPGTGTFSSDQNSSVTSNSGTHAGGSNPVSQYFDSYTVDPVTKQVCASTTPGIDSLPSNAPEPSSDLLIGAGLIGLGVFARFSRKGAVR